MIASCVAAGITGIISLLIMLITLYINHRENRKDRQQIIINEIKQIQDSQFNELKTCLTNIINTCKTETLSNLANSIYHKTYNLSFSENLNTHIEYYIFLLTLIDIGEWTSQERDILNTINNKLTIYRNINTGFIWLYNNYNENTDLSNLKSKIEQQRNIGVPPSSGIELLWTIISDFETEEMIELINDNFIYPIVKELLSKNEGETFTKLAIQLIKLRHNSIKVSYTDELKRLKLCM